MSVYDNRVRGGEREQNRKMGLESVCTRERACVRNETSIVIREVMEIDLCVYCDRWRPSVRPSQQ